MPDDVLPFKPRNRRPGSALKLNPFPEALQRIVDRGRAELAEAFRGITTDGTAVPGLFPVMKTGIPLDGVMKAAEAFLAALDPAQRRVACFPLESGAWREWHNMHVFIMRHGVSLETCSGDQRDKALAVVGETMSAAGLKLARDVMRLNEHIGEITGRPAEYGEWYYWLSILGTPSMTEPWGWQLDGHHLIVNCFILGDQMVLTPNFMGSEPVQALSGKYKGTRVFHAEEAQGQALMQALAPELQAKARLGMDLPWDVFGTAQHDNIVLPYEGVAWKEMDAGQRDLLWQLIGTYIGRIRPGHAELRLEEVRRHLGETHFAWIGACDDTSPFYYRVHSPVILIEFDHQSGVALDNDVPSRHHIHTLVRTPNGNDYGICRGSADAARLRRHP